MIIISFLLCELNPKHSLPGRNPWSNLPSGRNPRGLVTYSAQLNHWRCILLHRKAINICADLWREIGWINFICAVQILSFQQTIFLSYSSCSLVLIIRLACVVYAGIVTCLRGLWSLWEPSAICICLVRIQSSAIIPELQSIMQVTASNNKCDLDLQGRACLPKLIWSSLDVCRPEQSVKNAYLSISIEK